MSLPQSIHSPPRPAAVSLVNTVQNHPHYGWIITEKVKRELLAGHTLDKAQLQIWHLGTMMQCVIGTVRLTSGHWIQRAIEGGIWCPLEDVRAYLNQREITTEPEVVILPTNHELVVSEHWLVALGLREPTNHDVTPPISLPQISDDDV